MSGNYLGKELKKLGFGLMRLPMKGDDVDIEQTKQMVDVFMKQGFTYFDTAYIYMNGKSEEITKEVLVDRYPRGAFQLATKMPVWMLKKEEDLQTIFDIQLERTGAGFFDYYLLHSLNSERLDEKYNAWEFGQKMKEKGLIKHLGFSFHDNAECLDQILTQHPEAEFVQLQINYADWENDRIQSRLCYEVARKHNKPIIVMEPVKGGSLAAMSPEIQGILKDSNPDVSVASWAVRFAASFEGVITVLSGMSNMEQVIDNLQYMNDFKPLQENEFNVIKKVVEELDKIPVVPCTSCKYCVDDCPQSINIPGAFDSFNNYKVYQDLNGSTGHYHWIMGKGGKASDCIACGVCESHCPQHIEIIERLKEVSKVFDR